MIRDDQFITTGNGSGGVVFYDHPFILTKVDFGRDRIYKRVHSSQRHFTVPSMVFYFSSND